MEVPIRCFKCQQRHAEPVRNFMIGNVIFCPHCHKSMVVRDNLNFHIRTLLKDSYEKWEKEQTAFSSRRDAELAEFVENGPRTRKLSSHISDDSSYPGQLVASAKPMTPPENRSRRARALGGDNSSAF